MPHQRQAIREAAKAQLVGATAAGARVYETRIIPLQKAELPALAVYTLDESVTPASGSTAPRELTRNVELVIEGFVEAGSNPDDSIDALALEIEKAIHADETLGGACSDAVLATTETEVLVDGARPLGFLRLTYGARYYTYAPEADDVVLDDFKTADIRYRVGEEQPGDDQAHDVIEPDPPNILVDPDGGKLLVEGGGGLDQD